jgi:hypothetical protein
MRYLTAATIVAACSLDVSPAQAQSVVCQQIGTLTFCDQQQSGIQPWIIPPVASPYQSYQPAPMYVPLPGRPVIPTYQQPYGQTYVPLPGNRR